MEQVPANGACRRAFANKHLADYRELVGMIDQGGAAALAKERDAIENHAGSPPARRLKPIHSRIFTKRAYESSLIEFPNRRMITLAELAD